jgi:parvulin-like peptidyl-prolyl isomerase
MPRARVLLIAAASLAAGLFTGHSLPRQQTATPGPESSNPGPPVARFAGGAVGAREIIAALAAQPLLLRGGGTEPMRRAVEELVRIRVLALRAVDKGYDRELDVARRYAEQLAAAYVDLELAAGDATPTDEDVRAWVEANRGELARPERVRIAVISFNASSADERAAKRTKAAAALREARARAGEYYAFGELARAQSEDARTAARHGELGEKTREELTAAAGPEIAAVAFSHSEPGLHDAVVETAAGLHVVKVLGREAAYEPRLEDVRDTVRARLARERREARRSALVEAAWKEADVRIDEVALRKVVDELRTERR